TDAQAIGDSLAEPEAFAGLFDRHFDAVHGYAQRRVGPDLADEIAAETFTRAFDRRRSFDAEREDARPWLLGIAANLLRRHWRTERRRLAAYARSAPVGSPATESPGIEVVAALDSLSKDERETLFLYAVADLSYEEIALALDVPVGTVRSRLARARARVRARLSEPASRTSDAKESFNV